MRTTKRFTPTVLARFFKIGRGTGTFENYIPWHRVGRSDPSSCGRSHLQMWHGRQRELLSDGEWVGLFFAVSMKNLVDLTEQFPLSLEDGQHEMAAHRADTPPSRHPGTLEIAKRLGYKHPKTNEKGLSSEWVMTTDFILVLRTPANKLELLAVAFKPSADLKKKRTKELLNIEREYWLARGVTWLLITPELFDQRVALRLRDTMPWALGGVVPERDLSIANAVTHELQGHSLTYILEQLTARFGDDDHAKRTFWQSVWCGKIPLDLRRGWRPHLPVTLLSAAEFLSLNPIAGRRSSWI
ncbi:TnsA endonuclease N-terminal domain-containing protein [Gallionella capsiferriformans]|uniref:TnsA endonuclease n=1 Tax=Gallionella capsiferriformans (strain ES-2) TaxID=395494 RepID=D9SE83_GALCS|nr:TnsA endonuclease N-terminal domain-containing protein [Gallionella capsiferriformans]ADL56905.1 TnsA endonuclease [Gallionella capsiferriformans ES-2]